MKIRCLFALLITSTSIGLAQMGGGMPGGGMGSGQGNPTSPMHPGGSVPPDRGWMGSGQGNPTTPSGLYMQMFRNMGGTPMMGSGMGVGTTDDLTVAADGTAYVIRSIASAQPAAGATTSTSWQFELDAISPVDGSTKWKLPISSGRVSSPVLASDGLIYLTVDNYQMFYANYNSGGSLMTPAQAQSNDGQVLVISASGGSASIMRTIQTSSDVLSAPKIVADPAGGYMIYVLGYDMMSWTSTTAPNTSTFAPGEKTLYAYRSDGSSKFSVKLPQTGN
jgi:hypothetical protein